MAEKPITKAELQSLLAYEQEVSEKLRQVLKASEVLVASLEERLRESQASDQKARKWFDEEREETKRLLRKVEDLENKLNKEASARGHVAYQRDEFRDRLNRALGWIDHARGIGPREPAPDFAEVGLQHKGGGFG
jgi:signal transduction histidine kinase